MFSKTWTKGVGSGRLGILLLVCSVGLSHALPAWAQPGGGRGRGPGGGPGGGPHAGDTRHQADQEVFHYLLTHHEQIQRTVTQLPNGVRTVTESDSPEIAAKIQEHVHWMEVRIREQQPIRMRDPLFAEIFRHADKIHMHVKETERGAEVTETSDDPQVARLIQAHAQVVSGFVERGFAEAMKNHAVPQAEAAAPGKPQLEFPALPEVGGVYRLPQATQQPRPGTKIVVDLTRGGEAGQLNPGIEKLARYLNIYAGAGAEPVPLSMAVVLHGDATLAVLNDDAYSARWQNPKNPNLELLHELHERGVQLFVCGQSLLSQQAAVEDVAVFVDVAVSALTASVNLQADGFQLISLGN